MAKIDASEVVVGLVVFLDPELLKQSGRCRCSAWLTPQKDHAIESSHYFLIVAFVDDQEGWLMVPLSNNEGPNRGELNPDWKSGFEDQWSQGRSFYFQRQFWKASADTIAEASFRDHSPRDKRRYYAVNQADEIKAIESWSRMNRNPFRLMSRPADAHHGIQTETLPCG